MLLKNKQPSQYNKIMLFTAIIFCAWWLSQNVGYAINLSQSLPYKFFLVLLKAKSQVGDYILFKAPAGSQLPPNTLLVKKILAGKEDKITVKVNDFYINGKWMATAKTHSQRGEPLVAGPEGVLGENQYYVGTNHQDSFDSRYARIGWITSDLIIGVAYPLW